MGLSAWPYEPAETRKKEAIRMIRFLCLAAAILGAAAPARGQVQPVVGALSPIPPCGAVAAPPREGQSACMEGGLSQYSVRYRRGGGTRRSPDSGGEVAELQVELMNQGRPEVAFLVESLADGGGYRYTYQIANLAGAAQPIMNWALLAAGEDDTIAIAHPVWTTTTPDPPPARNAAGPPQLRRSASRGKLVRWTATADTSIPAGGSLSSFTVVSQFRPGWTNAYAAAGKGFQIPDGAPAEVRAQLAVLQKPENYYSMALTVGPKFGPQAGRRWAAADWHLGVQKMIARGILYRTPYFSELLESLQRIVQAQDLELPLTTQAKPRPGPEARVDKLVRMALDDPTE